MENTAKFYLVVVTTALLVLVILADERYTMRQGREEAIERFTRVCRENTLARSVAHTECYTSGKCVKVPAGIYTTPLSMCSYYESVMRSEKVWVMNHIE